MKSEDFIIYKYFFAFIEFFNFFFGFIIKKKINFNVTKVTTKGLFTTGHQNGIELAKRACLSFFPKKGKKALSKGQSPLQELDLGPRSRAISSSAQPYDPCK